MNGLLGNAEVTTRPGRDRHGPYHHHNPTQKKENPTHPHHVSNSQAPHLALPSSSLQHHVELDRRDRRRPPKPRIGLQSDFGVGPEFLACVDAPSRKRRAASPFAGPSLHAAERRVLHASAPRRAPRTLARPASPASHPINPFVCGRAAPAIVLPQPARGCKPDPMAHVV
eukprot:scaffold2099_cov252-Ochromonas_danica.AAC.3